MTVLQLSDLRVRYGAIEALHGVDMRASGGVTALIGANGAGKSTLLKTISGLLRPSAGTVALDGERIDRLPPHRIVRAGVVHVPEGRQLFPSMTVLENLEVGATTLAHNTFPERLDQAFELFPVLAERRSQLVGTLSGGEQQMVAIARGLVAAPKVLLMDEPSLGLAPLLVDKIADTIRSLTSLGMTILLVEQNARVALELASFAYVLVSGEVGLQGRADALLGDPKVVERYLGGRRVDRKESEGESEGADRPTRG